MTIDRRRRALGRATLVASVPALLALMACSTTSGDPGGNAKQADLGSILDLVPCPASDSDPECPTGEFHVDCANGTTEVDTQAQVQANQVCVLPSIVDASVGDAGVADVGQALIPDAAVADADADTSCAPPPSTCSQNSDCQSGCPAPSSGDVGCCDLATQVCFVTAGMCPVSVATDSGMAAPY